MPPKPKVTISGVKKSTQTTDGVKGITTATITTTTKKKSSSIKKAKKPTAQQPQQQQQQKSGQLGYYAQLLKIYSAVKHKLPLLSPTTISVLKSTFYEPLHADIDTGSDTNTDTGISLGYISPELYYPHPFVFRRDFIVNQNGKIGGFPSWLIPKNIPSTTCQHCQKPMHFLLQYYSPIVYPSTPLSDNATKDETERYKKQVQLANDNVHRIVYCFVCVYQNCAVTNNAIKIIRCQLPLNNPYIGTTRPEYTSNTLTQHDFSYPLETLIDKQVEATTTTTTTTLENDPTATPPPASSTPLCILCGAKATISCETYGNDTTPIYCSTTHQDYNVNTFHLSSKPTSPPTKLSQLVPNLLESTVLFPRLTFDVDIEVLDKIDTEIFLRDQTDLQIEEIGTDRSALKQAVFEAHNTNDNNDNKNITNDQGAELVQEGIEKLDITDSNVTTVEPPINTNISDVVKDELQQEDELIKKTLGSITDPTLLSKISPYLEEESSKTIIDKYQDLQTFSPTLDEVDNYSITEQDQTAQNFYTRMDLTLPPYIQEPFVPENELDVIDKDVELKKNPNILRSINNPIAATKFVTDSVMSKQILRFLPYSYRSQHKWSEPLWAHKLNRLKVFNSNDDTASSPLLQLKTKEEIDTNNQPIPSYLCCSNCGGRRVLEAQLTPYLCTFLQDIITQQQDCIKTIVAEEPSIQGIPSLETINATAGFDFGTIAIFTCENSCKNKDNEFGYVEEFGYMQPAV